MSKGLTSYNIEEINLDSEKDLINRLIDLITHSHGVRYEIKPISKNHIIVGLEIEVGEC